MPPMTGTEPARRAGARAALAALLVVASAGCTVSRVDPAGPTVSAGVATATNSSFDPAGVRHIVATDNARIDLSRGSLTTADLGVAPGEAPQDVSAPVDSPVTLTVVGSAGQLRARISTIRIRAETSGEVVAVSYFRVFPSVDELATELRTDAATTGLDLAEVDSFLAASDTDGEHQVSLNGGTTLGFDLSINVTIDHDRPGQVLQYVVTPADVANRYP